MSAMSELCIDIEEAIEDGVLTFGQIADKFNVTLDDVNMIAEQISDRYDDSMDGDHESALASAGWGTDEDYGYYGD